MYALRLCVFDVRVFVIVYCAATEASCMYCCVRVCYVLSVPLSFACLFIRVLGPYICADTLSHDHETVYISPCTRWCCVFFSFLFNSPFVLSSISITRYNWISWSKRVYAAANECVCVCVGTVRMAHCSVYCLLYAHNQTRCVFAIPRRFVFALEGRSFVPCVVEIGTLSLANDASIGVKTNCCGGAYTAYDTFT